MSMLINPLNLIYSDTHLTVLKIYFIVKIHKKLIYNTNAHCIV